MQVWPVRASRCNEPVPGQVSALHCSGVAVPERASQIEVVVAAAVAYLIVSRARLSHSLSR